MSPPVHPFVFVPLQRRGDSVIKYDSQVHDFGALVRQVLLLARGRFYVVCKPHPLDRDIDLRVPDHMPGAHMVLRCPPGRENDALNDYLLSRAALVVGVNSNMLFRALVFGTPAIATGRGWYSGSGAVHEVDGAQRLASLRAADVALAVQQRYIATCLARQLRFDELAQPGRLERVLSAIGVELSGRAAEVAA